MQYLRVAQLPPRPALLLSLFTASLVKSVRQTSIIMMTIITSVRDGCPLHAGARRRCLLRGRAGLAV